MTDKWTVRNGDYMTSSTDPRFRVRAFVSSRPWRVLSPYGFGADRFRTHAEAIAFAARMARDPEAELRTEVGT